MLRPLVRSAIVIGKVVDKKVKTLEVHIEGFDGNGGHGLKKKRINDVTAKLTKSFPLTVKSLYDRGNAIKYITVANYFADNMIQKLYKEHAYTSVFQSHRLQNMDW